jgi:hypothetical protein
MSQKGFAMAFIREVVVANKTIKLEFIVSRNKRTVLSWSPAETLKFFAA